MSVPVREILKITSLARGIVRVYTTGMERRPCPTGGKDLPGGAFCEACGVYSHSAAARSRPLLPPAPRAPRWRVPLAVRIVLAGAFTLFWLIVMFKRSESSDERFLEIRQTQSAPPVVAPQQARPRWYYDSSRAMSVEMQAAANRRLDELNKAAPQTSKPDPKEERRRKKRLARTGLGL